MKTVNSLLQEYMQEKGIAESEVNIFDFDEWKMFKLLNEVK